MNFKTYEAGIPKMLAEFVKKLKIEGQLFQEPIKLFLKIIKIKNFVKKNFKKSICKEKDYITFCNHNFRILKIFLKNF